MNTNTTARCFSLTAMLVAGLLAPCGLQAQRAPAATAATDEQARASAPAAVETGPASSSSDEVVIMSPFEVQTGRDRGFVAASSLAGGRLAGDLRDTPVAYSVLTKDFIDAMGLTDVTEMAGWATNTMDAPNDNTEYALSDVGGRVLTIKSRGVSANQPQKNFFPIYYNFDSYNIERLDFARGPNAVLFGTSSLGGTANSVTKRALTDRVKGEVGVKISSWGNLRGTVDFNQPLNRDLAVRVNGLFQEGDGWRSSDYEKRKGATLAATWKITRNTEIRAEIERYDVKKSLAVILRDNFSGWDGTVFDRSAATQPTSAQAAANGATLYSRLNYTYTPGVGNILTNLSGMARTVGGGAVVGGLNAGIAAGWDADNGAGIMQTLAGVAPNIAGAPLLHQLNLPASLYDLALQRTGGRFYIPDRSLSVSPKDPVYQSNGDDFSLSLTQRVGQNLFVEVALNKGREDSSSNIGISQMGQLYIDVNSKLPYTGTDGSLQYRDNPNFLQPYGEFTSRPTFHYRDKENARVALGYVTGRTKLGSFSFNLMGGVFNEKFDKNTFHYVVKNPDPSRVDPRTWYAYNVTYRYYVLDTAARPMPTPGAWTFANPLKAAQALPTGATNDAAPISTIAAGLVREPIETNASLNQVIERDYKYIQAAMSAKLFNDRLSLILSGRIDRYSARQENMDYIMDFPADWDGVTRILKPSAPSDWSTLRYRLRHEDGTPYGDWLPADTRPRENARDTPSGGLNGSDNINVLLPISRYDNDWFQDDYSPPNSEDTVKSISVGAVYHLTDWASVFANYADSFIPPTTGLKLDGRLFPGTVSHGWDTGLRFTLLGGRMVATAIYYEGREDNAQTGTGDFPFRDILMTPPQDSLVGYNRQGLQVLPAGWLDSTATRTRGVEFEITANLTRNWRLSFNAALPESYTTDKNKESLDYYWTNRETLMAIIEDGGGGFNAKGEAVAVNDPANPNQLPKAINAWNTLQATLANITDRKQKLSRVPDLMLNAYTDYTFSRGFLRGLRVGAGVQYRGREIIGYRGADTINVEQPDGSFISVDDPSVGALDPVKISGYALTTLTLGYTWRVNRKVQVVFDLRVANLFDYDKPRYTSTVLRPRDGDVTKPAREMTPYNYYWLLPRNISFTTRVLF
jgi:outer membrane receptor protein involved in Fe transport